MMLRIMLVGLVASLGLELPSQSDVAHWKRSGQVWVSARMADLAEIRSETGCVLASLSPTDAVADDPAPAAVETAPAASDATFEAVAAQVAKEFAADNAAVAAPAVELVAQVGPPPAPTTALAAPSARATPAPIAACEADEVPSDEAEVAMVAEASLSRAERINSAVKMTYQAVNAWASALQSIDEVDAAR